MLISSRAGRLACRGGLVMEVDSAQSRLKCDAENCAYLVTCSYLWDRTTTTVQASRMERTCTLHDPLKRLATYRSYTRYPSGSLARCSNAPETSPWRLRRGSGRSQSNGSSTDLNDEHPLARRSERAAWVAVAAGPVAHCGRDAIAPPLRKTTAYHLKSVSIGVCNV